MENKIAEDNQTTQGNPAPAVEASANTTAPKTENTSSVDVKPTESPVEIAKKKEAQAFIRMRQENRELKRKLAEVATPAPVTPQAEAPKPEPVQANATPTPPAPAQNIAANIEEESKKAIEAIASDETLSKVPGALMDIIDMVDSDPRLLRLHNIDPTLAFREAKEMYMSRAGISPAPPVPKAHTPHTGVGGEVDLSAMLAKIDEMKPGTKEWFSLAKKIEAEMGKSR